jgi:plasmid stability protein
MVQLQNFHAELRRQLKLRAAIEGLSVSDYVLREIRKALERPARQEVLERLKARPVKRLRRTAAAVIRAERNGP